MNLPQNAIAKMMLQIQQIIEDEQAMIARDQEGVRVCLQALQERVAHVQKLIDFMTQWQREVIPRAQSRDDALIQVEQELQDLLTTFTEIGVFEDPQQGE